ncbi:MAG TPA: hypothetical protein VN031_02260 [Candidatus Microsaccharimonas sp.]|nr:hypothetical protein [Candidatus Microsaccharimonas sp.]
MRRLNTFQKILIAVFVGLVAFWAYIQFSGSKAGNINFWFSFLFGLIPLFGGIVGMVRSKVWGGLRSSLGRAVFFVSLGLACWGLGESIWSYYNFFKHVAAPYPSFADIGFAPSIFFWVIGASFLAHASGAWLQLKRSRSAKLYAAVVIAALTALSYVLLIRVARGNVLVPAGETLLKVVLDIVYPLGDFLAAIFAFIVLTLSFKYLGGLYRAAIGAVLLGLGVMYVGDIVFSYTTTVNTYYNADWGDLLLMTGLTLLTFGTLGLSTKPEILVASSTAVPPAAPETPVTDPSTSATAEPQAPVETPVENTPPVSPTEPEQVATTPAQEADEQNTEGEER